jgi:hypothetical protein
MHHCSCEVKLSGMDFWFCAAEVQACVVNNLGSHKVTCWGVCVHV